MNTTLLNHPDALAAAVNLTTTTTTTTLNSTATTICTLTPHARALSSVLTGLASTLLTGLSSGINITFHVAWVCWFAAFRNVLIASYQLHSIAHLQPPEGGEHFFAFVDWLVV